MTRPEYPGNSKHPSKGDGEENLRVERIVVSEAKSQPKSLGKRLKEALIGSDSKTVLQYVITEVLVPQFKDMLAEATTQGFQHLIYGDSRTSANRRSTPRPHGTNYTNYNRFSGRGNNPIGRSSGEYKPNASIRTREFDDIVVETRHEAEAVLDQMYEMLDQYEMVRVADLYAMLGWSSTHTDQKWGWEDLQGSSVKMVRGGYLLILPKPVSLN